MMRRRVEENDIVLNKGDSKDLVTEIKEFNRLERLSIGNQIHRHSIDLYYWRIEK